MKKSTVLYAGIVCLAMAAGCRKAGPVESAVQPQAPTGGRLEVASPTFDNGVTIRGDVIRHVFELKNTGDAVVTINDVKAGCSCTAAVVSEKVVNPGASASVEVTFNTRGRSGMQSKSVKVFTSSSLTPVVILTVSGKVEPAVAFSSSNLQFGQVVHGQSKSMEVDLTGLRADGVTLTGLKLSPDKDPRFVAEIDPASAGRKVRVTFKSDDRKGVFRGRVDAATTSTEVPSIYFTVLVEVTGDVIPEQEQVMFPPRGKLAIAGQTRQTQKLGLKSLTGKPFNVVGVRDAAGLVKLVGVEPADGGFQLTLEGPLDTIPVDGSLKIELKGAESFEMKYSSGRNRPGQGFVGPINGRPSRPGQIALPGDVRMIKGKVKPWDRDPSRPAGKVPARHP